MAKLFWGFFFIYLNFNLSWNAHALNVLPPFVGYILLYKGMEELDGESGLFAKIRPFAVGMAVYTGILWCGDLFAIHHGYIGGWIFFVDVMQKLIAPIVALYVSWGIIQGVKDMETRRETDLNSLWMQRSWWVLLATRVAALVLELFHDGGMGGTVLGLVTMIAGFVGIVMTLVAFWKGKSLYEAC